MAAAAREADGVGAEDPPKFRVLGVYKAPLVDLGEDVKEALTAKDVSGAVQDGEPDPRDVRVFSLDFSVYPPPD